jgi:hypothetical protein
MERTYHNPKGTTNVEVIVEHGGAIPLEHIVDHSPTGMTWGYYGSGPHDLALSILADYFRVVKGLKRKNAIDKAGIYHHMFALDFVGHFKDGWEITATTIAAWLVDKPEGKE